MKIGVISDTHGYLDEQVFKYFKDCDEIWHAGDIGDLQVTDRLKEFKRLKCVFGNIDGTEARKEFKETIRFTCQGLVVMITHIGGKQYVYTPAIREDLKRNPPDIFVCGHSHILKVGYDKRFGFLYLNPGAAGIHGFHKVRTLLRFDIINKTPRNMEVIELGERAKPL
ncbi:metallophosphatase family protein [Flavobacteriales bacterium]|jgi:putative phosphoesterase|nr:metallophosphatase family protein [Flavobacteriales bacterium]MDC1370423.1 metallophosphatase family protein [Flavobacteriales bacterium]|tara:strand:+ start:16 stop:519 length:504 start_codon:yes stop_codon:yes gene_type:complete